MGGGSRMEWRPVQKQGSKATNHNDSGRISRFPISRKKVEVEVSPEQSALLAKSAIGESIDPVMYQTMAQNGFGPCTGNAHIHNNLNVNRVLEINREKIGNQIGDAKSPNSEKVRKREQNSDQNDEQVEEAMTEALRTKRIWATGGITFSSDDDALLASFITRRNIVKRQRSEALQILRKGEGQSSS
ncbi:hypothetical protein PIB30_065399 [Stylosanthes scabra]|uniref:Uncharacterized protein n=1 Tax=Stylosanthes scabra TaxID=79078 RepID=A0ABU6VN24_9FABA|nr:hypothetical protein [Stylosanthes scabra]